MIPEGLILQYADELDLNMALCPLPGARPVARAVHGPRPDPGVTLAQGAEGVTGQSPPMAMGEDVDIP